MSSPLSFDTKIPHYSTVIKNRRTVPIFPGVFMLQCFALLLGGPSTVRNPDPASASGFHVFCFSFLKNYPGLPARCGPERHIAGAYQTPPPLLPKARHERCMQIEARRRAGKGGGVVEQSKAKHAHRAPFFRISLHGVA
jgi:hypothetical protein